jgi:hypothetical protein
MTTNSNLTQSAHTVRGRGGGGLQNLIISMVPYTTETAPLAVASTSKQRKVRSGEVLKPSAIVLNCTDTRD